MNINILMNSSDSRPTSIRLSKEEEDRLAEIQSITGEKLAPLIKRLMRLQIDREIRHLKAESETND